MKISAEDRRRQLIDAAITLMRKESVSGIRLRAVAQEADAPLASVHYCFSSKDELVAAAVDTWLSRMLESATAGESNLANDTLRSVTHRIADEFWKDLKSDASDVLAQLEIVLWAARNREHEELGESIYQRYIETLSAVFEPHVSADAPLDAEAYVSAFLVIIDGVSIQFISQGNEGRHKRLMTVMLDALVLNNSL